MHARVGVLVTLPLMLQAHAESLDDVSTQSLSANIGYQSQYVFRGIPQSRSSAQAGLDYEAGGFYAGTWMADVEMGAEVDLYAGYGWTIGDVSLGIGATGYYYTDDFDDTYTELNLSASYGVVSVSYNPGRYDNFGGPTQDYSFTSVGLEHAGFFGVVGMFSGDFDGDYVEVGYGLDVSGLDVTFGIIYSDDMLVGAGGNTNLYFGVSKGIGIID